MYTRAMATRPLAGRDVVVALAVAVCVAATSRTASAPISVPAPAAVLVTLGAPATPGASAAVADTPQPSPPEPGSDRAAVDPGPALGPIDSGLSGWTAALLPEATRDLRALADAPRYSITLAISADRRVVTGSQETRYVNREAEPLRELVLRMFPSTVNMGRACASAGWP